MYLHLQESFRKSSTYRLWRFAEIILGNRLSGRVASRPVLYCVETTLLILLIGTDNSMKGPCHWHCQLQRAEWTSACRASGPKPVCLVPHGLPCTSCLTPHQAWYSTSHKLVNLDNIITLSAVINQRAEITTITLLHIYTMCNGYKRVLQK